MLIKQIIKVYFNFLNIQAFPFGLIKDYNDDESFLFLLYLLCSVLFLPMTLCVHTLSFVDLTIKKKLISAIFYQVNTARVYSLFHLGSCYEDLQQLKPE